MSARKTNKRTDRPELKEVSGVGSAGAAGGVKDVGAAFAAQLTKNVDDLVLAEAGGGLEVYEKVLRDDQVFSTFQQRRLSLLSKELDIQPGGTDKQSEMAAEFLKDNLANLNFENITNKMMYGIFYGYGVAELIWGRDGKNWCFENIKVRKARRFKYDDQRGLRLMRKGEPRGELMPANKFWTFESGASHHDNLYGMALASYCYWPVFFKRNGIRFWMLALEKYGAPTAVGKYPGNATDEEKKKLLQAVAAFASVSGVTIPEAMDISLLSAGSQVGGNHDTLISYMDGSISKVIVGQTMTTDDGSSQSQAVVHENTKDAITAADSDLLCGSFMQGPAALAISYNYPGANLPIMRRVTEEAEAVTEKVERDYKLFQMGWAPTEDHIRENYGDGYERVAPPAAETEDTPPVRQSRLSGSNVVAFEASGINSTAVDSFLASDAHADALDQEIEDLVSQIEDRIETADSVEDMQAVLAGIAAVPIDDVFAGRLSRALFNARMHGRAVLDPDEILPET